MKVLCALKSSVCILYCVAFYNIKPAVCPVLCGNSLDSVHRSSTGTVMAVDITPGLYEGGQTQERGQLFLIVNSTATCSSTYWMWHCSVAGADSTSVLYYLWLQEQYWGTDRSFVLTVWYVMVTADVMCLRNSSTPSTNKLLSLVMILLGLRCY
jgi:hypothetical protein